MLTLNNIIGLYHKLTFRSNYRILLLLVLVIVVLAMDLSINSNKNPNNSKKQIITEKLDRPRSAWDWRPLSVILANADSEYSKLNDLNVRVVYVDISEGIEILESNNEPMINEYNKNLEQVIDKARVHNVEIAGLTGHPDWIFDSHYYLMNESIEFIRRYNSSSRPENLIKKIQFDIEPHGLENFDKNSETYIRFFLQAMEQNIEYVKSHKLDIEVGYALPYWFDGQNGNILETNYRGAKKMPIYHIIDTIADYPKSSITFMAYRNYVNGDNGTINLVSNEFNYINSNKVEVGVYIGQELNDEKEKNITYHGKSASDMTADFNEIDVRLSGYSSYKGITVHEVKSLLAKYASDQQ